MKLRFLVFFLFAVPVQAAPMVRVVGVAGPSTIVVDLGGTRSNVQLAGIEITDPHAAMAFLTWSVNGSWVMIEGGQVYRSPDGMLVNSELVRKGFARSLDAPVSAHNAVYLGELDLGKRPAPARAPVRRAQPVRRLPVRSRARPSRTAPAPLR